MSDTPQTGSELEIAMLRHEAARLKAVMNDGWDRLDLASDENVRLIQENIKLRQQLSGIECPHCKMVYDHREVKGL